MTNLKEIMDNIDSLSYPIESRFITPDLVDVSFGFNFSELGRQEVSHCFIDINNPSVPYRHSVNSSLTTYKNDYTATLSSVKFDSKLPVSTPKATDETISVLEVMKGQNVVAKVVLTKKSGDFMTNSTITSGLRFNQSCTRLAWVASDKIKFERKSELGYTTKTYDFKDYGEDLDGIYHTSLVVFDIKTKKINVLGAPEGYGACKFDFASDDVIILQAIDLSSPRILGLRSYENRDFAIFAIKLSNSEFKILLPPKRPYFSVYNQGNTALLFALACPTDFGGHSTPVYPELHIVNLDDLEVTDTMNSEVCFSIYSLPPNPFIDEKMILMTIEEKSQLKPIILNLETFNVRYLIKFSLLDSAIVDDYCENKVLLRVSTQQSMPVLAVLNIQTEDLKVLTKVHSFDVPLTTSTTETGCDCVILGNGPIGLVHVHGGPHGMVSTYFNRYLLFFALAGFTVCSLNYHGSTGYGLDFAKSIIGHVGDIDVKDTASAVQMLRNTGLTKVGVWGWSHGGFLAAHMAGQYSSIINFVVSGAPVINFVSCYYTSDIPDWTLVESGSTKETDGEIEMNEEIMIRLWNCSPIRFAKNVSVPVLIATGKSDRRVNPEQAIQFYNALKSEKKEVEFLVYDNNNHSMLRRDAWDDFLVSSVKFINEVCKC